ncbi:hypothetical protein DRQ50_05960 [bacterium]|nr:MAG: hypothetical protein DRQ50_05960 [bacterium]
MCASRDCPTLRYFLDLPYADIACILDLPDTTVKSRLHTALGLLRVAWERQRDTPPVERDKEFRRSAMAQRKIVAR